MTVVHQDLSQLTPRMLGALSNVQTKVIFGIGRRDAEYFAKLIGRVDAEAVKRDPKTETQHELFSSLPEQWEQWVDRLRFQPARQATVASQDGQAFRTGQGAAVGRMDLEDFKIRDFHDYGSMQASDRLSKRT